MITRWMFPRGAIFLESSDQATGAESREYKDATDVARVAIDGRKWIASRFHPTLSWEKLFGNITPQQSSL